MDNIAKYLANFDYEDLGATSVGGTPGGSAQLHSFRSRRAGIPIMLPAITQENKANIAAWLLFMLSTVIGKTPDEVLAGFIDATTIFVSVESVEPVAEPTNRDPPIDPFSSP